MNPENNSTRSWKLIREIQKRRFASLEETNPAEETHFTDEESGQASDLLVRSKPVSKITNQTAEIRNQTFRLSSAIGSRLTMLVGSKQGRTV